MSTTINPRRHNKPASVDSPARRTQAGRLRAVPTLGLAAIAIASATVTAGLIGFLVDTTTTDPNTWSVDQLVGIGIAVLGLITGAWLTIWCSLGFICIAAAITGHRIKGLEALVAARGPAALRRTVAAGLGLSLGLAAAPATAAQDAPAAPVTTTTATATTAAATTNSAAMNTARTSNFAWHPTTGALDLSDITADQDSTAHNLALRNTDPVTTTTVQPIAAEPDTALTESNEAEPAAAEPTAESNEAESTAATPDSEDVIETNTEDDADVDTADDVAVDNADDVATDPTDGLAADTTGAVGQADTQLEQVLFEDAPQDPASPDEASDAATPGEDSTRDAAEDLTQDAAEDLNKDLIKVADGDSLWSIAAAHLPGDPDATEIAEAWPIWYELNAAQIGDDPNLIQPGQELTIPDQFQN